jgi:crotonobetainyl-CoA:carnitine CoA-transferase CaiB-like acyl-CoA transferase
MGPPATHPALDWALSGAMPLTGRSEEPPRLAPGPLATWMREAIAALGRLALAPLPEDLDGPALLGERAALLGLHRRGTVSPGGASRLLEAADGWIAVTLARPDDMALLPAWLGIEAGEDPWPRVAREVRARGAEEIVARARLLGLAAAASRPLAAAPPPAHRATARGPRRERAARATPRVLDLASLWAGPLCAHLLGLAGARVVKAESASRPDGARAGNAAFFDLLNAGKASVALDLTSRAGLDALRRLVAASDIVIESARPRALRQLGIEAEALVAEQPGLVWVAISAYGRAEPGAAWIGYGDDAAVAAGLAHATGEPGVTPLFCADAIADPLAGAHAAVSALAAFRAGEAVLLDVALADVAAAAAAGDGSARDARVLACGGGFEVEAGGARAPVRAPRARRSSGRARPLGADGAALLAELGC